MAYQFSQGLALNTTDFIKKLYTFVITTTGWTQIQDASFSTGGAASANTYLAASSTGESGQDSNVIRFVRNSANAVYGHMYLSYVTGGPPGTGKALAGNTSTTLGTGTYVTTDDQGAFYYWLFGSLDRIIIVTQAPSRLGFSDSLYCGSYTRARSTQVATCTNAPAAGTSVTFATTNTAFFTVGKRYTIADANNFESPKVTAINAGVSVTLDVISNSYAIGARLGEDPRPGLVTVSSSTLGWTLGNYAVAPPMRQTLAIASNTQALVTGEFVIDTVSNVLLERSADGYGMDGGPDGGGGATANGTVNMWPLFIYDASQYGGGVLGTMTEVFAVNRIGAVTDDTITFGGNTYHYINTAHAITATAGGTSGALGVAIRRA